jgi:Carboxypeptidase regulatory-like domain
MRAWGSVAVALFCALAEAREVSVTANIAVPDVRCRVTGFTARDVSGKAETVDLPGPVSIDGRASIAIVAISETAVSLTPITDDCWSGTVPVTESGVTFDFYPLGTVRGAFANEPPKSIAASFVDAATARNDTDRADEHRAQCSIDSKTWQCSVPAQRPLHLKVQAGDFAPIYLWDLDVRGTADTGVHRLARGGSVVGRVLDQNGRAIENARITLVAVTAAHQPAPDQQLLRRDSRSNAKGYFEFVGVPPNIYRVQSVADGRGDATLGRVEIRASQDHRLEPLVHLPMAELEVIVTPPVSISQRPWSIVLHRPGARMSEITRAAEGEAGPDGIWRKGNLQPGLYALTVLDAFGSEAARQAVELSGGLERVLVSITAINVRGKVVPSDLAGEVTVEFRLSGSRRVTTTTDPDGAFTATFPAAGSWQPSIFLGASAADIRLPLVEVQSSEDDLILEIPSGRVRGKVLTRTGQPLPSMVRLRGEKGLVAQGQTEDDGLFDLIGVTPGSYTAEAEAPNAFAGPVPVTVDDDGPTDIELRAQTFREMTGSVLAPDGTAASGAVVRLFNPMTESYDDTIADGRGQYSFRINPAASIVDLIVIAPPHPVALRRLNVGGEKRTISADPVRLGAAGGKLRVFIQRTPPWPLLRSPNGGTYSLLLLLAPRFGSGGIRELVDGMFEFSLEPGAYTLCSNDGECHAAFVTPHAETRVAFAIRKEGRP